MPSPKIGIVEIFRSVQGEGYNAGRDAVFVRLAGCNLSCVFAEGAVCDTPYQKAKAKLDVLEIMAEVQTLAGGIAERARWSPDREERPMLILTGGEPTLSPQFDALVLQGVNDGFYVAVETNGTKWRDGLLACDWVCVSPKYNTEQGSSSPNHNHNPQSPALSGNVVMLLAQKSSKPSGEYRYVIGHPDDRAPFYAAAFRHYVSPAVLSDGTGEEWRTGFPGFVPGALERCLEIVRADPRWRISVQQHKQWRVR